METSQHFWNASVNELKKGYIEETNSYVCLLCGEKVEKGIIYPHKDKLYEAERYIQIHIEHTHQSVFDYLIGLDKKLTGLTAHQNNLLRLFFQGKNDSEIQQEMGIGSTSTIRHHRFTLKEKERQAKILLAMLELLKDKQPPVHKPARIVEDRYNVTLQEQEKTLAKYFTEEKILTKFPPKEKQRLIVLREILTHFEVDRSYDEQELNHILQTIYSDYLLIRRYLIEYGFIDHKPDGSEYWVKQ